MALPDDIARIGVLRLGLPALAGLAIGPLARLIFLVLFDQ
jgi:hypothetical protein